MAQRPFILLVDDELDLLELYRDILAQIPSRPEVHIATTGARAVAMLESVSYSVLICDLKMPAMDGLQVLAIVRRRFPQLRTVIMTGLVDQQFRARAYGMGVDLFIGKPQSTEETKQFMDCIESLLDLEAQDRAGFRGVQNKSLVDIIQLECLCKSSAVLRIHNETDEGRIWFQDGEIVDAEVPSLGGEDAFRRILSWKTGNFEILPADAGRTRKIENSYQGLLLSSAQALDEAQSVPGESGGEAEGPDGKAQRRRLCRVAGVESGLVRESGTEAPADSWALDDVDAANRWLQATVSGFRKLGEDLRVGEFLRLDGTTPQQRWVVLGQGKHEFAVSFEKNMPMEEQNRALREILTEWAS